MQVFDISWLAIFKIMGAGAFIFVIQPLLFVLRDMLLHKAIDRWILTEQLYLDIKISQDDLWFLNNRFNKPSSVAYGTDSKIYSIDGKSVAVADYEAYQVSLTFHSKRFETLDSKINMKHNLITWLTRHYKQAGGGNPIPDLRELYYKSAEARESKPS